MKKLIILLALIPMGVSADYYNEVKFGKYNQAIIVYDKQIDTLVGLGYDNRRIIDLLSLKAMECNSYKGDCIGTYNPDIGHFQVNSIHKEVYKESRKLFKAEKWGELFLYQAQFANGLLNGYEKRLCGQDEFESIGKTYNNEERFKCYARAYNGGAKKKSYGELAWIKRTYIREYILDYLAK